MIDSEARETRAPLLDRRKRRVGRPVEAAMREVDALLAMWGEETEEHFGGCGHPIAKMMRDGTYGAVQSSGPAPISNQAAAVDRAVKLLPKQTRRAITFWYGSGDRYNQSLCLRHLRMVATEFKWRLRHGREQVAELLGLEKIT